MSGKVSEVDLRVRVNLPPKPTDPCVVVKRIARSAAAGRILMHSAGVRVQSTQSLRRPPAAMR
jgi:hypothetical protein